MCAIPFKGFDRKIHIKREAVTVSLFVYTAVRTAGRLKAIFKKNTAVRPAGRQKAAYGSPEVSLTSGLP